MPTSPIPTERRFLRLALLLGGLFVVVRIILFSQISDTPLLKLPILDSEFYYRWALRLAAGGGHPDGPFWLSPLYPVFLSGVFKAFGSHAIGLAVIVQFILSLGTLAAMVYYTRVLFGNTVALVTAGIAALYAPWLFYDGVLLSASLILFLNAALLLVLIVRGGFGETVQDTPGVSPIARDAVWIMAGILCGLSALARPSVLLFALALMIWLIARRSPGSIRQFLFFALALAVIIVPVLLRNQRVSGSMVLTTSSGGINFFIGNRAGASGVYDELDFVQSFDPEREAEGYRQEAVNRTGHDLTLNQASRYWAGQAFDDILHNPGGWLRLVGRKLWFTLQREEIPTNISFRGAAGFAPILGALPLRWGLLLPLAAAGMILVWRRRKELRLLWIYAAAYLLVNVVFFSASEYRLPMILVLMPAAGCFIVEIINTIRQKDHRRLIMGIIIYIVALLICNAPSKFIKHTTLPSADYYNMATGYMDNHEPIPAISLYARSLTADPEYRPARLALADALWKMGNYDDARTEYERAGVQPPDEISGAPLQQFLEELYIYTEEDDYPGALEFLNRNFPPDSAAPKEIWLNRAMVESGLKHYPEAISALEKGWALEPDSPEWPYKAGVLALASKDSTRADSFFTAAINRYPAYAPARLAKARLALAEQDSAEARSQLEELRRIYIPQDSVKWQVWKLSLDLGQPYQTENE
ncbi:MAG: tetratricopeptide repeat protein [Calditrichota bacterium]